MSEAEDVVAWITGDVDLSALIATRVHPFVLPPDPAMPAIVFQLVSAPQQEQSQDGPGLRRPRYRFKVWAATFEELDAIVIALRARFDYRRDGPFQVSTAEDSLGDYDLKTRRWWQVVDVLAWKPA